MAVDLEAWLALSLDSGRHGAAAQCGQPGTAGPPGKCPGTTAGVWPGDVAERRRAALPHARREAQALQRAADAKEGRPPRRQAAALSPAVWVTLLRGLLSPPGLCLPPQPLGLPSCCQSADLRHEANPIGTIKVASLTSATVFAHFFTLRSGDEDPILIIPYYLIRYSDIYAKEKTHWLLEMIPPLELIIFVVCCPCYVWKFRVKLRLMVKQRHRSWQRAVLSSLCL